jgi:hypothetical protein
VSCAAFERWLDDGMPGAEAEASRAHAAACPRCAAALAAAEALDAGLARAAFSAPTGLTDEVMARIAALEAHRGAPAAPGGFRDAFPWWVRPALDPAVVGAFLLCGLLALKWNALAAAGVATAAWLARASAEATPALPAWTPSLGMQIALAVILVPASMWFARAAFHASEKWVERASGWRV